MFVAVERDREVGRSGGWERQWMTGWEEESGEE